MVNLLLFEQLTETVRAIDAVCRIVLNLTWGATIALTKNILHLLILSLSCMMIGANHSSFER